MAFLKGVIDKAGFGDQLAKWSKDKDFMEGSMCACAWVAAADGKVGDAEKSKTAGFIQRSPHLKHFDRSACIHTFNEFCAEFEFSYGMGVDRCNKELSEVKDPDKAINIARLAYAIAASEADDDAADPVSAKERGVIREICAALRVDPKMVGV